MDQEMMIKQKQPNDCGVACLAMMLNKPYEEILEHFPNHDFDNDGLLISELVAVIEEYGHKAFVNDELYLRSKGILFVPSLNVERGGHFVYWDGPGKLYDPSNKKRYSIDNFPMVVSHIIVLNESNKKILTRKYEKILKSLKE